MCMHMCIWKVDVGTACIYVCTVYMCACVADTQHMSAGVGMCKCSIYVTMKMTTSKHTLFT